MLDGRTRFILGAIVLGLLAAVGLWLLLPLTMAALPGRVRQYLPSALAVQTPPPLPTPLPVATADSAVLAAAIDPTAASTPEPGPTAVAGATVEPSDAATRIPSAATQLPSPTPTLLPTPDYPPSVYLPGVKIIPQKFNNCGPTNLSMVLNYHGVPTDQLAIAGVIRPTYEDRNVSPEELAAYVTEQTGLGAVVFSGGDLDILKRLVAAGLPVIVEQGLLPDEATGWMGHYLTIYGYDEGEQHFYTRDSFLGPWDEDGTEGYESVAADWRPFNNVLVVVYAPEQRPAVEAILGERLHDPAAMWQSAAEQARHAIRANATDPFEWFNLGTSLTRLYQMTGDPEQLQQAVAAFDQSRLIGLPARMLWYQFAPYEAYLAAGRGADVLALAEATLGSQGGRSVEETYVYRALAFRALGDEGAAQNDLRRAELLNANNSVLRTVLTAQP